MPAPEHLLRGPVYDGEALKCCFAVDWQDVNRNVEAIGETQWAFFLQELDSLEGYHPPLGTRPV